MMIMAIVNKILAREMVDVGAIIYSADSLGSTQRGIQLRVLAD